MRVPAASWRLAAIGTLAAMAGGEAAAAPDFGARHRVGGIDFAADSAFPWLFYVFPPGFTLSTETGTGAAGGQLFLTRYTGSAVHGDSGETFVRSLLRFRVATVPRDPALLEAARLQLAREVGQRSVTLRPLPVARTEATVVAQGVEGEVEPSLSGGFFERLDPSVSTVFGEREFVLPLAPRTAQAFAAAHEAGGLALSLAYTVWTEALPPDVGGDLSTEGSLDRGGEPPVLDEETESPVPVRLVALADTLPVPITGVEQVDLDLGTPPDYPALRVYCFDFADELRDDLYLKEVEFDATGVAGGRTGYRVSFSIDDPAETVRSIRFPFAADISQPYRFRVLEVLFDGQVHEGDWQVRASWAAIIDATSIPEVPRAAAPSGEATVHYMEARQ